MTELERPIKRRSRMPFGHYRKRMVVMLHPGDKIAMRLEKSRTWYWAELDDVFRILRAVARQPGAPAPPGRTQSAAQQLSPGGAALQTLARLLDFVRQNFFVWQGC